MSNLTSAIKRVAEYPLPSSSQTHEVVLLGSDLLLVSQQPSGTLVKVRLDSATGQPLEAVAHVIESPYAGLHGLTASRRHPGCVWATLQFASALVLIDPMSSDAGTPPRVLKRVQLPMPARGPHVVVEDGDSLWASCKDSHHVVQINPDQPGGERVIACPPRPIFVQVHPESRDVYVTLDQANALFRIPADSASPPQVISIPAQQGSTPVGMVPGPDDNLWFALLGNTAGVGAGFGRIHADQTIEWFHVTSGPASGSGFIHLGFPTPSPVAQTICLLASSMASPTALNAVVELTMSERYGKIESQQTIAFPSQQSMSHRVLCTEKGIFATELGACCLVHLQAARSPHGERIDEASDSYALWGCGVQARAVRYGDWG